MTHNEALVRVDGLSIETADGSRTIVEGASFRVAAGEVMGLVGESGSGKTTTALALLGRFRPGLRKGAGSVIVDGVDPTSLSGAQLSRFRGARVSYVAQDPAASLNPALRVGTQLRETLTSHPDRLRELGISDVDAHLRDLVDEADLARVPHLFDRFPHQLSGGQQQRVVLAMAFALRPAVIVLDEPTTGLDVTTQKHVLDTMRQMISGSQIASVFVSHDLAVVSSLSDHVCVFKDGHIVEAGTSASVFSDPQDGYTRDLIAATPRADVARAARTRGETVPGEDAGTAAPAVPVLDVGELNAKYGRKDVLNDIGFTIGRRECVAVVGESGSGKTTLARCIIGLQTAWSGRILLDGAAIARGVRRRPKQTLRRVQYVFQNPYTSLNPQKTIGAILEQPLRRFMSGVSRRERQQRVRDALRDVSLSPDFVSRYPSQLSGGERQRVAIARALIARPDLIICDEITSALDVSVQARILQLLKGLQDEYDLSILFITHNMAVVRSFADTVAVISQGRIVEFGDTESVFENPQNPYTVALLDDTPTFRYGAGGELAQGAAQ